VIASMAPQLHVVASVVGRVFLSDTTPLGSSAAILRESLAALQREAGWPVQSHEVGGSHRLSGGQHTPFTTEQQEVEVEGGCEVRLNAVGPSSTMVAKIWSESASSAVSALVLSVQNLTKSSARQPARISRVELLWRQSAQSSSECLWVAQSFSSMFWQVRLEQKSMKSWEWQPTFMSAAELVCRHVLHDFSSGDDPHSLVSSATHVVARAPCDGDGAAATQEVTSASARARVRMLNMVEGTRGGCWLLLAVLCAPGGLPPAAGVARPCGWRLRLLARAAGGGGGAAALPATLDSLMPRLRC
jgi:hypothetical protein